jgi:glycosyltransferase involved in cell wall biosynthesis
MRILQLIDSLEAGGAERMAVNYANALASRIAFSGLVATRKEGALTEQLAPEVGYLFLNRKKTIDVKALMQLRTFVRNNKVDVIHAHGSSFLLAVLLKITYPRVKILWHDHNGNRVKNKSADNTVIKWGSLFFSGVLTVNHDLEMWAKHHLKTQKIAYIPNFATINTNEIKQTRLSGEEGKRMVCLANLRHPKNHLALIKGFQESGMGNQGWSLHLIGKDSNDQYANHLRTYIQENNLEQQIFIYGSCSDVFHILSQADIGVLASTYEGFPVTLLEYGLSRLAVVSTNVGYCPEIIKENNGLLFDPNNPTGIGEALKKMTQDSLFRKNAADNLNTFVANEFSEDSVMIKILNFYKKI